MQLFFAEKKKEGYFLDEKETHHCHRVLRKKEKEKIYFINGNGSLYEGTIAEIKNKSIRLTDITILRKSNPPSPSIHIGIAPTKQFQRMEWFLEKAVECGVNEISLIKTKRTERYNYSFNRIRHIIRSAMKQSLMLWEPKLNVQEDFEEFLEKNYHREHVFKGICHMNENATFFGEIERCSDYIFLIGPEGDFTEDEVKKALEKNYREIYLGTNRLRTETAGLYPIISIRSGLKISNPAISEHQ